MGARESFRITRPRAGVAGVAALAVALAGAGCGGEDDFANDPRPAAPIVVTARVDSKEVEVSPDKFGAGLVNITVSNLSDDPVRLTLVGPGPEDNQESSEIPPAAIGNLKAAVNEGDSEVNGGDRSDAQPAVFKVGPPRPNSNDQLLLP